ncbi:hypothetical protein B6A27_06090 [Anoxybacillus sp. UARK-01]|nr:hypothetical protein B6A27_06090 [Anoxybacillus sp. UARK-01]
MVKKNGGGAVTASTVAACLAPNVILFLSLLVMSIIRLWKFPFSFGLAKCLTQNFIHHQGSYTKMNEL